MARSDKDRADDLKDLRKQYKALEKDAKKANDDILGASLDINKAKELSADITAEINKLMAEGRTVQADALKISQSQTAELQSQMSNIKDVQKGFKTVNDELQSAVSKVQDFVKKLPGGGMLSRAFGIDELGEGVKTALNKSAKAFIKSKGSITAAGNAFSSGLLAAVNPITMIVAAATALVMIFLDFEKKAKGVAEATGLTLQQSKALVLESKKAASSFGLQLATSEDILEVQKATIKEFGIANMLTGEQAGNVAEIGKAFGIGAKAASGVTNEFMRMGLGGTEAANALQDVSADALKAGVSVGTVTADIAANAKDVAKFFGGNVKALQKAAVQAAKLGVSLKTMASVSEGLLKFEDSISSQFEFQALTGKQMNLDSARQLALQGDIAGATKEVLGQVGSIAEFDNMSFLARKKLAEATGMSVDELQKSLTIQSKLGDLTADQQAAMANMGLSAAEIKNMSSEELKDRLAQQQATDKLAAGFSAIKSDLMKALIPAGEAIVSLFGGLAPLFKVLGGVIKIAFLPITLAGKALKFLVDLAHEFKNTTIAIATATGLYLFNKKMSLAIAQAEGVTNAKELVVAKAKAFFENNSVMKALTLSSIKTAILGTEKASLATRARDLALGAQSIVQNIAAGAAKLAGAVAGIFQSFAFIPFGLGLPLAIAAAAGLYAKFGKAKKAGDVGIDPNGGPIVASPREGGIFQGTKNDGVSMSPSHGANGGGGGNVVAAIAQTNALLRELIAAGTTIEMDGQLVGQVLRTTDSFRRR